MCLLTSFADLARRVTRVLELKTPPRSERWCGARGLAVAAGFFSAVRGIVLGCDYLVAELESARGRQKEFAFRGGDTVAAPYRRGGR